jgi:hypothetical protein
LFYFIRRWLLRCWQPSRDACWQLLPGLTALVGRVPYRCTRVAIWAVDSGMALVHAQTAWHDTGWDGPAWRVVPVEALHHFAPGWAPFETDEVRQALGSGWGRVFRYGRKK